MKNKGIIHRIINGYKELSFEEKTKFSTKFSIIWNTILGLGKILLSLYFGIFFVVAGIINFISSAAKAECYFGMNNNSGRSFEKRNTIISILLFLSGLMYTIYMAAIIFWGRNTSSYGEIMGICVALVSFVEMGIAIIGLVKVTSKGHYYRNIKIINFCSALTAIVLTEIALLSFASTEDNTLINGLSGMFVGLIIMILGIYVYFAPRYSIVDKEHNVYKKIDNKGNCEEELRIDLCFSRWYGGYSYIAKYNNGIYDGHIIKTKNTIFKLKPWWIALIIVLSEILIFPYAVGAVFNYIKCIGIIDKLDDIMEKKGFEKITQ